MLAALVQQQPGCPGQRLRVYPVEAQRRGQAGGLDGCKIQRRHRGEDVRQAAGGIGRARADGEMIDQHLDRRHRLVLDQQHIGEQGGDRGIASGAASLRFAQQEQRVVRLAPCTSACRACATGFRGLALAIAAVSR